MHVYMCASQFNSTLTIIVIHNTYTCTHTYIHTGVRATWHRQPHISNRGIYIHTYMHTYTHTHIHTKISLGRSMFIHTHIHTYIHTYIQAFEPRDANNPTSVTEEFFIDVFNQGRILSLEGVQVWPCSECYVPTYVYMHVCIYACWMYLIREEYWA